MGTLLLLLSIIAIPFVIGGITDIFGREKIRVYI